ncbi:hypothetical protein RHECIAT_CH0003339 [Rhizobium etli CIAT 652]|uniref:Uncharacterized protein n=1 Tax=Rhizobium etli (strain CIAT 652) TaxID=491916 RepID=B3PVR7_RHIE6|nr:hypothetical protein RHECIAT_CH0003339 [Rhizobium etli CIAT 652]
MSEGRSPALEIAEWKLSRFDFLFRRVLVYLFLRFHNRHVEQIYDHFHASALLCNILAVCNFSRSRAN